MRRFFDYNFDRLDIESETDLFEPFFNTDLTTSYVTDILAAQLTDIPLSANIDGTPGDDTLNGTADADTINGFAGNDIINGLGGDDILNGGDGDDIISGGEGFDTIDGGAGFDLVSFGGASERVFVFLQGTSFDNGDVSATNIEGVIGTDFGDSLFADRFQSESVYFDGGAGDDRFLGSSGDDTFIGGDGDDFVIASLGSDIFDGGAGSDRLSTFSLGLSFNPTEVYSADLALGQILNNGFGEVVTLINVEGLSGGTFFADTFLGDANDNVILGNLGGADFIDGRAGDDILSLTSGTGTVIGGDGIDIFNLESSRFIEGTTDQQDIFQGAEINLVAGTLHDGFNEGGGSISEVENLQDTYLSDVIIGDSENNIIELGRGADFADGGGGIDTISFNRGFNDNLSTTVDLSVGTAVQSFEALTVSSPASLDIAFLEQALSGNLAIRFFTTDASSGIMRGVFRGVESDSTDANGVRTVIFNPFGLDDGQLRQPQFTSARGEAHVTMILDAAGNLTYTATVTYENIDPTSITDITFRYGDTIDTIHFILADGVLGPADIVDNILNFENIIGSTNGDSLTGDAGANEIEGGQGDDFIDGGSGTDTAIYVGEQSQYTITNNGDGTFTVTDNVGDEGTDTLANIEFIEFADGQLDVSTATGPINGTSGNDSALMGTSEDDVINGLAGNDILNGLAGDDVLNGGGGADRLIGGAGADVLNGGTGFDTVDYRGSISAPVRFNVDTGGTLGEALGDAFSNIERYYLTDFGDVVTGSDANEFFFGEGGNDQINGGGGIDRIYGGDGNDIQRGQAGNDTLFGSDGADQLNGGTGFDIANYSNATGSVIVRLSSTGVAGDAAGDTYFGIEAVFGSDFNDAINGNASANDLRGGDGNDTLDGEGGNDRLTGGEGADILDGGLGTDIAVYTAAASAVTVDLGGSGSAGEANGDFYDSIEWVWGSAFNDDITGDAGNNRLEGRDGNDVLNGESGNDRLLGGNGNDTIFGGDGVDTIFGQDGDDTLFGGDDNDFFFGGAGADSHDGGDGIDTVSYLASGPITIQNGVGVGGDAAGDTYVNIERYFGSSGDDIINASGVILGNGGNDYLQGMNGTNDSLNGGAGVDTFAYDTTGGAADVIQGFFLGEQISILGEDANFDTEVEILAVGSDAGNNVVFNFGNGNTLTIVGFNLEDLPNNTFTFEGTLFSTPDDNSDVFEQDMVDVFDMDALL